MTDIDWHLVSFDEPQKTTVKADDKGTCHKCGRHIGKGIHLHLKACDGHPAKAG
ncbi:hypothetical protein EVB56_076 [Rhizobium phage RHph_Y1_10]|nr:hypothetical protein EVB56_076 [Rhizobium phage RHph_Y1_10]